MSGGLSSLNGDVVLLGGEKSSDDDEKCVLFSFLYVMKIACLI